MLWKLFQQLCVIVTLVFIGLVLAVSLFPETEMPTQNIVAIVFGIVSLIVILPQFIRGRKLLVVIVLGLLSLPFILYQSHVDAKARGDMDTANAYVTAIYVHLALYVILGGSLLWYYKRHQTTITSSSSSLYTMTSKDS